MFPALFPVCSHSRPVDSLSSQCSGFPSLTSMDAIPSSLSYIQQPGTLGTVGTGLKRHELGLAPTRNRRGTLGTTQQSTSTRIDSGRKPVLAKQRRGYHPNCAPGDDESVLPWQPRTTTSTSPNDLLAQAEKFGRQPRPHCRRPGGGCVGARSRGRARERRRQLGLKSDKEVEAVVDRAISEYRNEQRGR